MYTVINEKSKCPKCGGGTKYFDYVKRTIRTKNRTTSRVIVRRFKCINCGAVHRETLDCMIPYKQYDKEVIMGVVEGFITSETLGFEDYPCEATMVRWKKEVPAAIITQFVLKNRI